MMAAILAGCGGGGEAPTAGESGGSEMPAASSAPVETVDPATAATVTGKVNFQGQAPQRMRIRMDAVPACTEANPDPVYSDEVVVNDNGTLANVFVYVKAGLEDRNFGVPSEPVVIDQRGCMYHPHVMGLVAGQKLQIKNSDPTNHNVHPMPMQNREWNKSQPPGAPDLSEQFPRPEVMIPVKCNVHPWMKAYVGVLRHPFFGVTDSAGNFEITGLPPGEYTIEAWHEKYGSSEQQITVGASETKEIEFSFQG